MSRGLIIFAREPVPGKVKTRLAQSIGDRAAAGIYSAMLSDTVHKAALLDNVRIMIFWATENGDVPEFSNLPGVETFVQSGEDLGKRMDNAFNAAFSHGVSRCCIIGSDSPDLPIEFLSQAFDSLDESDTDIVYGPAEDGGYYLLGMKQLWSPLFKNMQWSSPAVMVETVKLINKLGLKSHRLPQWHDIDTYDDLLKISASCETDAPLTHKSLRHFLVEQDTRPGQ